MRLKTFAIIITLFVGIWVVASVLNVNAHNTTDMIYASWNIFTLIKELLWER